jgi:glycosyltransferase involved in cell wall biosynthesis
MRLGPEAIEIVYNGVAPITPVITDECCNRIRSMLDVLPGDVLGILVGRLVDQKNVPVALRAVKLLETEGKRFRLAIAGDGPLRQRIEEQIEALGLSRTVILLGHLADVERLIAASDILVLPSFREGLSNVILEAMMAGKAVIASDVGGNGELVEHGSTGLLFPSDDDVALAASLRSLIIDGTLRARFGAAARTRARVQFGVPVMIRAMDHHYEKCGEGRDSMRAAL